MEEPKYINRSASAISEMDDDEFDMGDPPPLKDMKAQSNGNLFVMGNKVSRIVHVNPQHSLITLLVDQSLQ